MSEKYLTNFLKRLELLDAEIKRVSLDRSISVDYDCALRRRRAALIDKERDELLIALIRHVVKP